MVDSIVFFVCVTILGVMSILGVRAIYKITKGMVFIVQQSRSFKRKMKEVEQMRERGELHSWVSIPVYGEERLICKKTGWCPSLKGFASKEMIDNYLIKQKKLEQFEAFTDKYFTDIGLIYSLSLNEIKELIEKLNNVHAAYGAHTLTEQLKKEGEKKEESDK